MVVLEMRNKKKNKKNKKKLFFCVFNDLKSKCAPKQNLGIFLSQDSAHSLHLPQVSFWRVLHEICR